MKMPAPLYALAMGVLIVSCNGGVPVRTAPPLKPGESVPEFSFADQNGSQLTISKLRPKAVLMTFIFTRCTSMEFCPRMSLKFQETRAALDASAWKDRVELLSVTLDPKNDTVEVMGTYSKSFGALPGSWTFATCTPDVLAILMSQFGVRAAPGEDGSIEHNLITALVDSHGRVQRIWEGNKWSSHEILAELPRAVNGDDAKKNSRN
jgi:protein SCO1/2